MDAYQNCHTYEEQTAELERLRARLAELGTVYVKPDNWNSFKEGGGPSLDDCEKIDLSTL